MTATKQRSVRIPDDDWARLVAEAKDRGQPASDLLLAGYLRPSFRQALDVLELAVVDENDRLSTLGLADEAPLASVNASTLRAYAHGLNALAARWPR